MLRHWFVGLAAVALVLAACGADDGVPAPAPSTAARPGLHGHRTWYDARLGVDDQHVLLTLDVPVGTGCEERYAPEVHPSATEIVVFIPLPEQWAPPTCSFVPDELEVDLGEPLGSRALVEMGSGWAFRIVDGELALDPASTPCGRVDCSTPSATKAPCDGPAVNDLASAIDGGDPGVDVIGCDGSFLIGGLTIGAGGCPPDERQRCARPQRAYFVAREGQWRLVTYGRDLSCDEVAEWTRIRFPREVCTSQ